MWLWRPWVRVPSSTPLKKDAYGCLLSTGRTSCSVPCCYILGCSQGVRQRTLTPSFRAFESRQPSHCRPFSNGRSSLQYSIVSLFRDILCTITAKYHESLAQPAEHLTFNQGVRGSNPRWFTKKKPHQIAVYRLSVRFFFLSKISIC